MTGRLWIGAMGALVTLLLTACPRPQMPKGPPPEYEEPIEPAWDAGTSAPPAAPNASPPAAPPPATEPSPSASEPQTGDAGATPEGNADAAAP